MGRGGGRGEGRGGEGREEKGQGRGEGREERGARLQCQPSIYSLLVILQVCLYNRVRGMHTCMKYVHVHMNWSCIFTT